MEKVNDLKSWSFEKINKIYKPLTRLAKKLKKKTKHHKLLSEMKKEHLYRSQRHLKCIRRIL